MFCFTEKRSIKEQEVSGHIKVNISATIDGEEIRTPFHEQYTKLHEVMERGREGEGERERGREGEREREGGREEGRVR